MAEPVTAARRGEGWEAKIPGSSGGGDLTGIDMDDVEDLDPAKLQIEEAMVAEVMRRLEEEISRPCAAVYEVAAALGGDSSSSPFFSAAPPAVVTVKGNQESCGPSFSDSASTVMASIDTRGAPRRPLREDSTEYSLWPWPWLVPEPPSAVAYPAAASGDEGFGGGGGGGGWEEFAMEDVDDEWLARVLNGAGWFDPDAERGDPPRPPPIGLPRSA